MNMKDAILTEHALEQLAKRHLTAQQVRHVLEAPDTIIPSETSG